MKNIISKEEKDKIDLICKSYKIENYSITSDGSIDVDGNVKLDNSDLYSIPLRFGKVTGRFYCYNNKLTSLVGAPHTVGGEFNCFNNRNLTSLTGGPTTVGGEYNCAISGLTDLVGSPDKVGGFNCSNNKLTTLQGSPEQLGGYFNCSENKLTTLEHIPSTINGDFHCRGNELVSTYSGDTDCEILGNTYISSNYLSNKFYDNFKIILKYQRHFEIWNADLSLNYDNFQMLVDEIEDGLK